MNSDLFLLHWPEADRASFHHFVTVMSDVQARIHAISGVPGGVPVPRPPRIANPREYARLILAKRHELRRIAGEDAEMFGDPAWEILLSLFQAEEPMTEAAVLDKAGLSSGAGVARRWIALLVDRDWVVRDDDGHLSLGTHGQERLARYFSQM
ncbi:hypothetical protein [Sphingomonas sp.]|uniref:hypothetical protein n=1 Tax=Sphingomonas sp. TaxID=28214 RepID=UPI0031E4619E